MNASSSAKKYISEHRELACLPNITVVYVEGGDRCKPARWLNSRDGIIYAGAGRDSSWEKVREMYAVSLKFAVKIFAAIVCIAARLGQGPRANVSSGCSSMHSDADSVERSFIDGGNLPRDFKLNLRFPQVRDGLRVGVQMPMIQRKERWSTAPDEFAKIWTWCRCVSLVQKGVLTEEVSFFFLFFKKKRHFFFFFKKKKKTFQVALYMAENWDSLFLSWLTDICREQK